METIQGSTVPTRRILHTRATPQAAPAIGVEETLSTQCTRKTYPTSGNSFLTLKDMIGNMGLLFSFCLQKALLIVHPYSQVLLAVMITSLANHSR